MTQKLEIGLYRHKTTGKFDVMIDCIDNTFSVHNGEFEKIESFKYEVKTKEEELREEIQDHMEMIKEELINTINPVFLQSKTMDSLDDNQLNYFRELIYDLMCLRRKLLGVNEYKSNYIDKEV